MKSGVSALINKALLYNSCSLPFASRVVKFQPRGTGLLHHCSCPTPPTQVPTQVILHSYHCTRRRQKEDWRPATQQYTCSHAHTCMHTHAFTRQRNCTDPFLLGQGIWKLSIAPPKGSYNRLMMSLNSSRSSKKNHWVLIPAAIVWIYVNHTKVQLLISNKDIGDPFRCVI